MCSIGHARHHLGAVVSGGLFSYLVFAKGDAETYRFASYKLRIAGTNCERFAEQ